MDPHDGHLVKLDEVRWRAVYEAFENVHQVSLVDMLKEVHG